MTYYGILKELLELNTCFSNGEFTATKDFIVQFIKDRTDYKDLKVIGLGAGRMGYSLRAFIMRLSHMGIDASMIGDTNVPVCNPNTLIIINSSSGETPSIKLYTEQANEYGATTVLFTSKYNSSIGKIADHTLVYGQAPSKQVMKTLYEQFTYLMFDKLAADLREDLAIEVDFMEHNHSILE